MTKATLCKSTSPVLRLHISVTPPHCHIVSHRHLSLCPPSLRHCRFILIASGSVSSTSTKWLKGFYSWTTTLPTTHPEGYTPGTPSLQSPFHASHEPSSQLEYVGGGRSGFSGDSGRGVLVVMDVFIYDSVVVIEELEVAVG